MRLPVKILDKSLTKAPHGDTFPPFVFVIRQPQGRECHARDEEILFLGKRAGFSILRLRAEVNVEM